MGAGTKGEGTVKAIDPQELDQQKIDKSATIIQGITTSMTIYIAQFRGLQARKEVDQIKKTTTQKYCIPEQTDEQIVSTYESANPHAPLPIMAKLVGTVPTFVNEKTQQVFYSNQRRHSIDVESFSMVLSCLSIKIYLLLIHTNSRI